jgi:3-oxoacyl-[acyl-carrier-protein] synthase-3
MTSGASGSDSGSARAGTVRQAAITGVGSAVPERVVPNAFFEDLVDTTDEWIRERTGIRERRFAGEGETTGSMATLAGRRALDAAGVSPEALDLIIVATCTPDRPLPATAAAVQRNLGASCAAFDLNAACAGFIYGVSTSTAFIESGAADRILLIGAETLSRVINLHDRTTCVLFGDGAGAAVLERSPAPGVIDSALHLDGNEYELLTIPAGGAEEPTSADSVAGGRHAIVMPNGQAVFKKAVVGMASACASLLEKNGLSKEELDLIVPHQANARIIAAVADRLHIDHARVFVDMEWVGNTSAASIPIAIDRAWRSGRLHPGQLVLTTAFGAGLAWGANLLRWTMTAPDGSGA